MGSRPELIGPIVVVVGARPNFVKAAPLMRAFRSHPAAPQTLLVHTGQHYDVAMSDGLFADLKLAAADVNLEVGSGTHAVQTSEVMRRFEPVLDRVQASCVVVVGDVNSTLACSLVAVKKGVAVVHVEAGLRSFDRTMPEEINRLLTDQISDLLYTTERSAADNLKREGIPAERIHFVGNVMVDSLLMSRERAIAPRAVLEQSGKNAALLDDGTPFGLVTLHRPSNVDSRESLVEALETLREISDKLPLIWLVHPRTQGNMERFGLNTLKHAPRVIMLPPQGYLETIGLMSAAALVLTDSGGIQEETTVLGVPCLTMRENTERPVTIDQGTNVLVGADRALIRRHVDAILAGGGKRGRAPELWDGHASERIAAHLGDWLIGRQQAVSG